MTTAGASFGESRLDGDVARFPADDARGSADTKVDGPLTGVRVIDLTTTFMGPYCTMQLARMGADVVKVEEPSGDVTRGINNSHRGGLGSIFINANHGKRSVAIDLKNDRGREILLELAKTADVVMHNMRRMAIAKLGLTAEDIHAVNPRCIYVSLTGFGAGGSYEDLAAYDDVIQSVSGLASIQGNGQTPVYVKSAIADKTVGLFALSAVMAALYSRTRTGRGSAVTVPMFECMVSFNLLEQQGGWIFDPPDGATGYARLSSPYRRPYRTSDGYLGVVVYTDRMWASFFELIGSPELATEPRFRSIAGRTEHIDELYRLVETELAKQPSAYWLEILAERGIPAVPVRSVEELFADPHLESVGLFEEVQHPIAGRLKMVRYPVEFSDFPDVHTLPAPMLGQHSEEVLREAGVAGDEIESLIRDGIVPQWTTEDERPPS